MPGEKIDDRPAQAYDLKGLFESEQGWGETHPQIFGFFYENAEFRSQNPESRIR
jgi:hypothetical protein